MPIKHIVQAQADKYAQGMFLRQEQYALRVKARYDYAVRQLLDLARQVKDEVGDKAFRFTDYPQTRNEATKVIRQLYTAVYGEIKNGVEAEWEYANLSCDGLVQSVFGKSCIDNDLYAQYFERNREAMEQFFKRKSTLREGLGLSQRVWKYTGDLRTELENAVTVSLGEGVSADTMSRRVRQYLQYPDKLFRRVRGADGKLHLSKAAKAFHPGQGVYRSSYKNAMRLTRTETNAAYRLADESRWGKMDFVVGIEIKKSNNHPSEDICDTLCGKYPKDFKFSAWHPQCRCYVTPILCTPEEMARMQRNILSGNADANTGFRSVNEVAAPPKVFNDWVRDNQERIVRAKSLPYFLRDNGVIKNGEWVYNKRTVLRKRKNRTQAQIDDIQMRWNIKRLNDTGEYSSAFRFVKRISEQYGVSANKWEEFLRKPLIIGTTGTTKGLDEVIDWYYDEKRRVYLEYKKNVDVMDRLASRGESLGVRGKRISVAVKGEIELLNSRTDKFAYGASVEYMKKVKNIFMKYDKQLKAIESLRTKIKDLWSRHISGTSGLDIVVSRLERKAGIGYNPVSKTSSILHSSDIVDRLGGGDLTKGSCSSLAFAYAANKGGLDVLDFRGGSSRDFFAGGVNIFDIVKRCGGIVKKGNDNIALGNQLLQNIEDGKEYYFTCGRHAAIVRKNPYFSMLGGNEYEYLELQHPYRNGWKPLSDYELENRFGTSTTKFKNNNYEDCIIEISKLYNNPDYQTLMGYINTSETSQMKGTSGYIR